MFHKTKSASSTDQSTEAVSHTPTPPKANDERKRSIIQNDIRIEGHFSAEGILEFGGTIVGNVTADTLILTRDGTIHGDINARHVTIEGTQSGKIVALNVNLKSSARLQTDIIYDRLCIESGAQIEGHLHHRPAKLR